MKRLIAVILLSVALSAQAWAATKTVTLSVTGMTCTACPITVKKALDKVEGVEKTEVTFEKKEAVVTFDDAKTTVKALLEATKNAGYPSTSLALPLGLAAQEHPTSEHPTAEQPMSSKAVTMDQLAQAIQAALAAKTKEDGGKFDIQDAVLHKTWALTFVRVHKDRLAQLGPNLYFACTDFRADDGTMVDVDFYMNDKNGKLVFSDTAIHKVNGKPRFTYEKKGNYWERVKTY